MYKNNKFILKGFTPAGDQPRAIKEIMGVLNSDVNDDSKKILTTLLVF